MSMYLFPKGKHENLHLENDFELSSKQEREKRTLLKVVVVVCVNQLI